MCCIYQCVFYVVCTACCMCDCVGELFALNAFVICFGVVATSLMNVTVLY